MRTTVAHSMSVASGMPLAAIGAREEVAPHCVTDLGDYACRHVATRANLCVPFLANGWEPREAQHSCALLALRRVHSYPQLSQAPSRSREKVPTSFLTE